MSRLAVECGAWPLYEVEDGERYTLNLAAKTAPVDAYLAAQKRYRHLNDRQLAEVQAAVDRQWAQLTARAAASAEADAA
jgi:pyruvate/2-oxoacid:ferredoxin oxidoreductase beta subunit